MESDRLSKAEALIAFMSEQPTKLTEEGRDLLMSMLALARKGMEAERVLSELREWHSEAEQRGGPVCFRAEHAEFVKDIDAALKGTPDAK